jgi:hypothetical protein
LRPLRLIFCRPSELSENADPYVLKISGAGRTHRSRRRLNSLDEAFRKGLWKKFHENEKWFELLSQGLAKYKGGEWPRSLVDCVFQYDWHHKVDIYDIYVLQQVTTEINSAHATGRVFQIPVASTPLADRDHEGNNRLLRTLPSPFTGKFWGGTQDEDGLVRWNRPIHVSLQRHGSPGWALIEPGSVQLEVGYNSSAKFYRALMSTNGVARWPYGQPYITVFLNSSIVQTYTPEDRAFRNLLKQSGETLEECMGSAERSPWERWYDERNQQRTSMTSPPQSHQQFP